MERCQRAQAPCQDSGRQKPGSRGVADYADDRERRRPREPGRLHVDGERAGGGQAAPGGRTERQAGCAQDRTDVHGKTKAAQSVGQHVRVLASDRVVAAEHFSCHHNISHNDVRC